ncbi:MAG TPA: hypothetical protein VFG95_06495, partial [Nitrospiria bacterium]|nr:hypothetical protein [Nitrospiria bacterium]
LKRRLGEIERLSLSKDAVPKPLLSGDDVMALLGLSPGPEIGRLLSLLREEQLAGRIRHRNEAEDFLKSL